VVPPNKALHQTGHAIDGCSSLSACSRVSRLLNVAVRRGSKKVGVNVRAYPRSVVRSPDPRAFFGPVRMVSGSLEEILQRAEELGAGSLYDSDFSGSIGFADWWYHYACELDLPLIRAIDDPGLVASGAELDQLEAELDRLEACWAGLDLSEEPPSGRLIRQPDGSFWEERVPFDEHLRESAATVREAIQVARDHGGVLVAG
jgi:hypothetical protein